MEDVKTTEEIKPEIKNIEYDELEHKLKLMVSDPNVLKNGYKILSEIELYNKFHLNLLNIVLNPQSSGHLRKLASCCLKIFTKKNWNNEAYISQTEKMVLFYDNLAIFGNID